MQWENRLSKEESYQKWTFDYKRCELLNIMKCLPVYKFDIMLSQNENSAI